MGQSWNLCSHEWCKMQCSFNDILHFLCSILTQNDTLFCHFCCCFEMVQELWIKIQDQKKNCFSQNFDKICYGQHVICMDGRVTGNKTFILFGPIIPSLVNVLNVGDTCTTKIFHFMYFYNCLSLQTVIWCCGFSFSLAFLVIIQFIIERRCVHSVHVQDTTGPIRCNAYNDF